jgi:DNA repair protein RecN (Recombination protein N)
LGAKADKTMIRHGENECFVKAEFLVDEDSSAAKALREMDVETDGLIVLSRKFTDAGKNVIKVNGNAVTATMLRKVTDYLVDVHGQSEHFFLLKESNQLKMLDSVIGEPLRILKEELKLRLQEKKEIDSQIALLGGDEQERSRRLDVLKYQIDEITALDLKDGEEEELKAKRNKINNLEKIITALREGLAYFTEEQGINDSLRSAVRSIGAISRLDDQYAAIYDKMEEVAEELEDISETLSDYSEELYFDENEAESVEARLDAIHDLMRKYGANKEEIDSYLEKINAETYGFEIGEKKTYKANGSTPLWSEFNRIESASLLLYNTMMSHKQALPRLSIVLGGQKGFRG